MRQQMALGNFIFGLSAGFAYERLERKTDGGWASIDIVTSKPKSQQVGQKLETLQISGKSMYATGMTRLDQLRELQAARVPLPLVDGIGRNWGRWRVNLVTEVQTSIIDDGTALVINWTINLEEFVNA
ncbi:hypothetical protein BK635_05295 [Pseudomonas chlororaphis]|uniref:phage tail protein n=1 Tax=Pseudomonas chlororaphis TaxID=587753 RepID=UPI000F46135F|nr:phage tail protein [Pseudomonas chlororaphis]RON87425.1 hypothetical protein BK635_05295 [Pseudomonas chlororaphis]